MKLHPVWGATLVACGAFCSLEANAAAAKTYEVEVPAQLLRTALPLIKEQTGLTFWFAAGTEPEERRVPALSGAYTAEGLLSRLLSGSDLTFQPVPGTGYEICQQACASATPPLGIPEILVRGASSRNMDIPRDRDAHQSYIVIGGDEIRHRHASSPQELILEAVPSASRPAIAGVQSAITGESEQIDLRGLGRDQTAVLLDGRRVVSRTLGGEALQSSLGLPVEAIERIEVHGTTSSARFGGNAAAGSINIIQRHRMQGAGLAATIDAIPGMPASAKVLFAEVASPFASGRGRASGWVNYSVESELLTRDRDLVTAARGRIAANNPANPRSISAPPLSSGTNVLSANGASLIPGYEVYSLYIPAGWTASKGLAELLSTSGQYAPGLAPNAAQGGELSAVRPRTERESASASVHFDIGSSLSADAEAAFARILRDATASGVESVDYRRALVAANVPANPFGQPVWVTAPLRSGSAPIHSDYRIGRAVFALQCELPGDWMARAEYAGSGTEFSLERPVLNVSHSVISDGVVNVFEDPIDESAISSSLATLRLPDLRSSLWNTSLLVAGSLWKLPAGTPYLTVLVERRGERLVDRPAETLLAGISGVEPQIRSVVPEQHEHVDSAYAELNLPLLASVTGEPDRPLLDGQLTVRADDYRVDTARVVAGSPTFDQFDYSTSKFSALSWMASMRFEPYEWLALRGGCGRGFMPPSANDVTLPVEQVVASPFFIDPARGSEPIGPFRVRVGGNPDFDPERINNCTAGVIIETPDPGNLRVSVDFTRVSKTDVIYSPSSSFFSNPSAYILDMPTRVTRAPVAPGDTHAAGRILEVDASSLNVSEGEYRAWDVSLDYTFPRTRFGVMRFSSLATMERVFASRLTEAAPLVNDAGVGSLGSPRGRGTVALRWEAGRWSIGWDARIISRYRVSRAIAVQEDQGGKHVRAQNYHDLWVSYVFPPEATRIGVLELQLGAKNLFQKRPPLDAGDPNLTSRFGWYELPALYLTFRLSPGRNS